MNMQKIFKRIYRSELRWVRPNLRHRRKLKKQLGFGFSWRNALVGFVRGLVRPRVLAPAGVMVMVALLAVGIMSPQIVQKTGLRVASIVDLGKDDWQFKVEYAAVNKASPPPPAPSHSGSYGSGSGGFNLGLGSSGAIGFDAAPSAPAASLSKIKMGFAVGGAKDTVTFRENIQSGFLPKTTAITPEGLFYDYFFDTTADQGCTELFCPTYLRAISADPISGEENTYLAVGLNSGLDVSDFERKPLDLIVVLDISGSMSANMAGYYYDDEPPALEKMELAKNKMQAANEAVVALTEHLEKDDRFGIVLFNDQAHLAKPLSRVGDTDMAAIKSHVLEIRPQGGTNMEAGMRLADQMYSEIELSSNREQRMIVLTDAMPNRGRYGTDDFIQISEANAERGVYTTFIGVGLDFQTDLVEDITKVRGGNYYSVFTVKEFVDRMDKGFDHMVSPLVFDLKLNVDAPGYKIEEVYGSPDADLSTGEIIHVRTLFPTETTAEGARGGIIVLRLEKTGDDPNITLTAEYLDLDLNAFSNSAQASFADVAPGDHDNTGVRKGVLLARYADLLRSWVIDEHRQARTPRDIEPLSNETDGIRSFQDIGTITETLSEWERGSTKLTVSPEYIALFTKFRNHLQKEMAVVGDQELQQEIELLNTLIK